jgi:hypothetical protein
LSVAERRSGASQIVLRWEGLCIQNIQNGQRSLSNIPTEITFQNGEIRNARKNCIGVENVKITNVKMINNRIHYCGHDRLDHGVYLSGSNHLVEYNEFYNNPDHGMRQYYKHSIGNSNSIVRYNYIHDNWLARHLDWFR